jgi:hypothetical protein
MIPQESQERSFSEYPTPASQDNINKSTRFLRINQGQNFSLFLGSPYLDPMGKGIPTALIFGEGWSNI